MKLKITGWFFWKRVILDFEEAMIVFPKKSKYVSKDMTYLGIEDYSKFAKTPITITKGNFMHSEFFKKRYEKAEFKINRR